MTTATRRMRTRSTTCVARAAAIRSCARISPKVLQVMRCAMMATKSTMTSHQRLRLSTARHLRRGAHRRPAGDLGRVDALLHPDLRLGGDTGLLRAP